MPELAGSAPYQPHLTYSDLRKHLEGGGSLREVVEGYLRNIKSGEELNAFLEVYEEEALERADAVQEKIRAGNAGSLAGMVIGLKDNICYEGHRVSASSKILEGFESVYSATVVERLIHEDAIIIGRLNCDEFAMGASNENSAYGPVLNAKDPKRVPGGSSGGSVVAVQAGLCFAALGSDTGGSIRQPASFTGTVGAKPTYGRVSRWGLLAYASSFDQIGPVTHTVADNAKILEVIAGGDDYDATCSNQPVPSYLPQPVESKLKIAVITDCLEDTGLDKEIKGYTEKLMEQLESEGHEVETVPFPYLDVMVPCYYVLTTAEASSNLSRYSGMLYGHRSQESANVDTTITESRTEGFGPEVKRRIMTGTFVLSEAYYDAYYSKAQKVRRIIKEKTEELLETYDAIMLPTTPTVAFELGEKASDPIAMYLADIYTVQAPLAGLPAISVPVHNQHSTGMPFGIQLIGRSFGERELYTQAQYLEHLIVNQL
jgi:aspartyl-tRNA(Asn)/glutamyl-tRNA(Gln) amidotransferase subunit A